MNIVYAAEKPSIAKVLGDYVKQDVRPEDIMVTENPDETGSFFVGWRFDRYVLSPSGQIACTRDGTRALRAFRSLRYAVRGTS
jgi:hypothetical protein